ncbi:MAG: hypothetical protein HYY18_10895 [Planctomycetes bacterium]|nr:hypothetical protein [Planctomycetota bacterium]
MTTEKSTGTSSRLTLLRTGIAVMRLQRQVAEPGPAAAGFTTFEQQVMEKRNEYAMELERVLDELKLTTALLAEVAGSKEVSSRTHEPEELINYYSGVFFDLVHQTKDKLIRLVELILRTGPFRKKYKELESVRVAAFLKRHGSTLEAIGIKSLLEEWKDDGNGPLSVVLKHRTQHHHNLSKLQYDNKFLNVRMSKILRMPQYSTLFSEEGRRMIEEIGAKSLETLKADLLKKQTDTIELVEKNLNQIASRLIEHFKIPTDVAELVRTVTGYSATLRAQEVSNETSAAKLQFDVAHLKEELTACATKLGCADEILSVYVVGSAARGELARSRLQVDVYVITKNVTIDDACGPEIHMRVLSQSDFASEKHKKDRFICWSDGLLLVGSAYKFEERDFPRPGVLLAILLNENVEAELESGKGEASKMNDEEFEALRRLSLRVAKLGLDFLFALAMSIKPFYSSSRRRRIEHIKATLPPDLRFGALEQLYHGGTYRQADLVSVIELLLQLVRRELPKLLVAKTAREAPKYKE